MGPIRNLRFLQWCKILGLTLEWCVGQIIDIITDNGHGNGMTLSQYWVAS